MENVFQNLNISGKQQDVMPGETVITSSKATAWSELLLSEVMQLVRGSRILTFRIEKGQSNFISLMITGQPGLSSGRLAK